MPVVGNLIHSHSLPCVQQPQPGIAVSAMMPFLYRAVGYGLWAMGYGLCHPNRVKSASPSR